MIDSVEQEFAFKEPIGRIQLLRRPPDEQASALSNPSTGIEAPGTGNLQHVIFLS